MAWIGTEDTAFGQALATASGRTRFVDTMDYASYDLVSALTLQAFQAANNLLDKLAGFLGLHLELPIDTHSVYFCRWWSMPGSKPAKLVPELVPELDRPNLGLWGLVDLSDDFDSTGRYRRLQKLRHAATHRIVVVHREGQKPASTGLIEHVRWLEIRNQVVRQLQLSRAALFYLARAVDGGAGRSRGSRDAYVPAIPLPPLAPPGRS